MKILKSEQIRKVDQYTIEHEPVKSADLMERAASAVAGWIKDNLPSAQNIMVFAGPGNNGGDGLALARMLAEDQRNVKIFMLTTFKSLSPDALVNYQRIPESVPVSFLEENTLPRIPEEYLVIDALFGSGLSRPLTGMAADVVKSINLSTATVLAIDIPSGLYGEINTYEDPDAIIRADVTLTFQFPKLSLFFAENEKYAGQWHILDISLHPGGIELQDTNTYFLQQDDIAPLIKKRKKFSHKGTFGHGLLIAGSYGKMGAAILSSQACLRTGIGLLTSHVVSKGYAIIQTAVPEAIVSIDSGEENILSLPDLSKLTAVGIGPGIGTDGSTSSMLHTLLKTIKIPLVIDADALNILSLHPDWHALLPENAILTPHPGEFDRLMGSSRNGYDRFSKQTKFSVTHKVIIILKGAYTSISAPDGSCWFNSTGNPGMATAGSGDVLTGIILSLLSQNYEPLHAALTAVFLHGLAGDLASADTGEEALIASDIINHMGKAFQYVKLNSKPLNKI